jgi:hypothetical protein
MATLSQLRKRASDDEKAAQRLMADKDKLREKLRKATDRAAVSQKALLDAEAAEALAGRDDLTDAEKAGLADRLGLELPR